ncbi:DNA internalization-related competence protein ComEC/Rec2 [Caenimonas terrae]|uniref:DNA internalization-related competence protein ComEC/Rec2 n=1 Tax=Caenimonas terrae TaxID=696074 RepID=A0ABW0NG30_9BURK
MTDTVDDTGQQARPWLAWGLLGLVAGSACQLQQQRLWGGAAYAALAAIALACLVGIGLRRRRRWNRWLALPAAALLAFALVGLRAVQFAGDALAPALEGRDIALTGVVAAMPQRNDGALRFRFELESASMAGRPVQLPPQLYLGWYPGLGGGEAQRQPADLRAGERWLLAARLKAPHGNFNPHGFDYELWLWEQGLQATGYVRAGPKDPPPRRIGVTWRHPVEAARQSVRDRIDARVADPSTSSGQAGKAAGLLAALVVGDQAAIDRADWDVFRATGVAHLMSISGLHITMFAWAAAWAIGWLWRRSARLCLAWPAQHAALVGGIALATGYAVFSGWGVPAQRTVLMLATVAVLRLWGRRWPWPQVWLLACAVVVAVDPWALLQAGFWLSFVAVGVLFASDAGAQAGGRLAAFFREQAVVTLALLPLTVLLFGQVSVVSLLANAVAIPWVTLLVTPLALAGVLAPPLWDLAAWAVQVLGLWLGWLAAWPWATVAAAAPPPWAAAAGLLGGILLVLRLPWPLRALGLPLLLPVLLWQPERPLEGEFELLAADIGQGNAVIVRTAGHTLVYDSGPRYSRESDAGHRVLVPLLRALGERVDTLVLSHRDADHTGGAAAVLAMQPQAALVSSIEDDHELQALRKAARCVAGQRWHWDGVEFELLHPQADDYLAPAKSNAMSCVLRIANGRQTALLVGDIEAAQEARLVSSVRAKPVGRQAQDDRSPGVSTSSTRTALSADVLLVPHHGSKTSSTPAFLQAVRPRIAIVQAGYRNRFGHPAPPVLERYRLQGVRVIQSPQCGAAWWRSVQPQAVQCQRATAFRYWNHRIASP